MQLSDEGKDTLNDIAKRHDISVEAVSALLDALKAGHGVQAQFNHPDLGGMGQWSAGGMLQIGDMFNDALKSKVDKVCKELAHGMAAAKSARPSAAGANDHAPPGKSGSRWPSNLGDPVSQGSQNDMHYAVFPNARRLAVEKDGQVTIYDTADHRLNGISQQQGKDQTLQFASDTGVIDINTLQVVRHRE